MNLSLVDHFIVVLILIVFTCNQVTLHGQTTLADQDNRESMLSTNLLPGTETFKEFSAGLLENLSDVLEKGVEALRSQLASVSKIVDDNSVLCSNASSHDISNTTDPDISRNSSEIIESRGFQAKEYDIVTDDGYILTIQRIINPLIEPKVRKNLRPVLLQHGLITSSADWIVTSVDVRPSKWPVEIHHPGADELENELDSDRLIKSNDASKRYVSCHSEAQQNQTTVNGSSSRPLGNNIRQQHPNALGFYLANQGYDVFLGNSRGNFYGQRHTKLSSWNLKFWNFTFDEQIKYDLPAVVQFIQQLTNQTKLGYVGHSQGTTMVFGLMADKPHYADIIEPVVALAPVAHIGHCISPLRLLANYTPLKLFQNLNLWFIGSNPLTRYFGHKFCNNDLFRRDLVSRVIFLICGFDEDGMDDRRLATYLTQMASGTSVKNIVHWAQLVNSGKFARYDYGPVDNQLFYNQSQPPEYDLRKIRSKSISIFTAENDWLSSPEDVALLKQELPEPLFREVNVTIDSPNWNHIDFVYGKDAGRFINARVVEIMDHFRAAEDGKR